MTWKRKEKYWYKSGHILSTALTYLVFRPKIVGKENIPKTGGILIAPNHRSFFDIPVLGCTTFRPMRFMAKKDLFKNKFVKWYFETNGSFSVNNEDNDAVAVKKSVAILKSGDALVVFPEGKRIKGNKIGELASGAGFIAIKSGAPILPIGISGLDRPLSWKFGFLPVFTKAKVVVGKPIFSHLEQSGKTSEILSELLPILKSELQSLYEQSLKI